MYSETTFLKAKSYEQILRNSFGIPIPIIRQTFYQISENKFKFYDNIVN